MRQRINSAFTIDKKKKKKKKKNTKKKTILRIDCITNLNSTQFYLKNT